MGQTRTEVKDNGSGTSRGGVLMFWLKIEDRSRVEQALKEAGYILRARSENQYGFRVWDPRRVKLDREGLVEDDGYVATLNTKRVDAVIGTGIEGTLRELKLPKPYDVP